MNSWLIILDTNYWTPNCLTSKAGNEFVDITFLGLSRCVGAGVGSVPQTNSQRRKMPSTTRKDQTEKGFLHFRKAIEVLHG